MKHRMNKKMRLWLLLTILLVVAVLAALWATSTFWLPPFPWGHRWPPPYDIPGDIEFFYTAKTVVSTINVTLLIFLSLTYISIYKKTRSEFTIGLTIFSMVLLFYALSSNPLLQWVFGFRAFGLGPFAMLPDLFTCAALVILLYLTVKY
jgi:hypothetical protein